MSPWWQLWWLRAHDGERWWHAEDGRGQQKHLNCYLLYPPLDSLQNHWQQNSEEKILTSRRKFDMGGVPVPPWLWATSVPQHSTCPKWEKCVYLCVRVCVCVCWGWKAPDFVCLEVVCHLGQIWGLGLSFAVCSPQWVLHLNVFLSTLTCFDCFTRCFPQGKFW